MICAGDGKNRMHYQFFTQIGPIWLYLGFRSEYQSLCLRRRFPFCSENLQPGRSGWHYVKKPRMWHKFPSFCFYALICFLFLDSKSGRYTTNQPNYNSAYNNNGSNSAMHKLRHCSLRTGNTVSIAWKLSVNLLNLRLSTLTFKCKLNVSLSIINLKKTVQCRSLPKAFFI